MSAIRRLDNPSVDTGVVEGRPATQPGQRVGQREEEQGSSVRGPQADRAELSPSALNANYANADRSQRLQGLEQAISAVRAASERLAAHPHISRDAQAHLRPETVAQLLRA